MGKTYEELGSFGGKGRQISKIDDLIGNIFPPLDNPELTIRRRSRADPTLLNNFEMAAEGNSDLPVPDLRTMEELCQPSLNGRGRHIAPIAIQAMNLRLKNDMIQQVQNSCHFHGLSGDDANNHLDKFLHVTQSIKVNEVTDDALRLKYFPPSMVTKLRNEITNFRQCPDESLFEAWEWGTFMKRRPKECYDLIENMNTNHNDWDTSAHCSEASATVGNTQNVYAVRAYQEPKQESRKPQSLGEQPWEKPIPQPQVVTTNEFTNFMKENDAILKNMQNLTSLTNSNLKLKNMFGQFIKINTASSSGSGTLLGNTITNPKEELKGITTRSGTTYQGPTIPTTFSSLPLIVKCETEETKDTVHLTNNRSIKDVQPLVIQTESLILNSEPIVAPIIKPVVTHVSALKPNQKPSILYPSRLHDQNLGDKANDPREKFVQIFKDLNFNISFVDALILMPKFGPTIKTLFTNKDKLSELARTLLNEHCLVVLLKKLLEKLGDPSKFLIPLWNKLLLPDLSTICMTLELADRSISHLVGVAEDVFVKVGTFHFPGDFVVVDFDADPRIPLILGRSFLKTKRALIDVFKANYNDMMANRIDVIDMACEDYSQEVLSFFDVIASGNPTPYFDSIVSTTSLTLTLFRNSDFLLGEVDAFLALEDDPTSPEVDQADDLPPHPEYTFLEGDDKFPVIIAKDLSVEEKTALIKGINPEFCTHKILMGEDFEPAVLHLIRVNPKIHDVIKNEVLKLLNAGLIYPISDSPWVSPVYYVPKTGGFTVVENEENELISTCLVTRWHVCINYHKLNEATRKDHFPLPFMDQMLKRLPRKEYYCFSNGFLGYFQIPIDPKDKKPHSLFHTEHFPTIAYLLGYAMHQVLLLQEFTFKVIKTKGAENLATDHLSRLENPHQNVLDPKEINESFPLETLNMVSFRGNSSTPWFADCANYHSGNFVVKGMSSQQKNKFFKKVQPNEINELCDQAYENSLIYKEKTKRLHDSKIKDRVFNIDDRVFLFNSRLKIFFGKLKSDWSGPFTISHVFPYGTVELSQPDGLNFKVNGHRLKHYFREDIPKMVVPDLQTFPKDQ
nr:hypothetical protein [Tanacetum cinerariifolium]